MSEQSLYNREAEEALVGSLFLEEGLVKDCYIQPEELYSQKLGRLLAAIRRLDEKGKPVDVISVVEEVGTNHLDTIGGIRYITELVGSVPTTANFDFYQKLVKEYAQKRKAMKVAGRIHQDVIHNNDIESTLRSGIQHLLNIEEEQTAEDRGDIQESLVELYTDCGEDPGDIPGIASGFPQLDRLTGGFQPSDLIVVGARPSVGKTAFALNLALQAAKNDISLIFSLEMSKKQLLKRAAGFIGRIDSMKMRNPRRFFGEKDWWKFSQAMGKLSNSNLHIFDRAGMDANYIWSKVRQARRRLGSDKRILIVVDYLQLIVGDPKHHSNRQAEISEISRRLKHMARELDVAVVALSQLSRAVESRQDKRPLLSDLRESGQIEQDADVIAFLYREDYYEKGADQKNRVEVIIAKQRNGPIGTVPLAFLKEYGKFVDSAEGSEVIG